MTTPRFFLFIIQEEERCFFCKRQKVRSILVVKIISQIYALNWVGFFKYATTFTMVDVPTKPLNTIAFPLGLQEPRKI